MHLKYVKIEEYKNLKIFEITFIKFKADSAKVNFAKETVPTLPQNAFKHFKPIFDFITSKISSDTKPQTT